MSDVIDRLQSLARWLWQMSDHEPEPDTKASHIQCAQDCEDAAKELTALRARVARLTELLGEAHECVADSLAAAKFYPHRPERIEYHARLLAEIDKAMEAGK